MFHRWKLSMKTLNYRGDRMRIILVHIGDIIYCPPAINVTQGLLDLGHEVILCTTKSIRDIKRKFEGNIKFEFIDVNYETKINRFHKLIRLIEIRKELWKTINQYYDENSIIWVVSDISIKHLGHKLLNTNYILHLMELSEEITYYHKIKFLKLNSHLLGNNAFKVIVPEYNRAHIVKAWWKLKNLPSIIENKPYIKNEFQKHSKISSEYAMKVLTELESRKIILYQGIIHKERPLDEFIRAVDLLGDDYAFVLMSKGDDIYNSIGSKNYYFIPFVEPPYHLEITSHAYIGILSYFPVESDYSILNAIFCAPNKTYEYGMFGIPMISNDVPSLKYIFNKYNCGVSVNEFNKETIMEAILKIESNYDEISRNAKTFYDSVDIKEKLNSVLE